jgi:hypothetical protein
MVEETIEYLEDREQPEWKRSRPLQLVTTGGAVWVARGGIAALVVLLLLLLVFAVNATGWFGHSLR